MDQLYQPEQETVIELDPVLTASPCLGRRLATMGEASKRVRLSSGDEIERYLATPASGIEENADE